MLDIILNSASDAMLIMDKDNLVVRANQAFERLTGYSSPEVCGSDPAFLDSGRHEDGFFAEIRALLDAEGSWTGNVWNRCKDGRIQLFRTTIRKIVEDAGKTVHFLMIFHESLTDPMNDHSENHDFLTGLPNRRLFMDRMDQSLISARRAGNTVALLLVGLDRFSRINEGLGHNFGDLVLKETAARLSKCIRQSDTASRLEADRFGLITPISSLDDSVIVAEKVLKAVNAPFVIEKHRLFINSSIGISLFPTDADSVKELEERAFSAMRYIKGEGGNQYQFFASEMNIKAKRRLDLETGLRRAIDNEEFEVYYQPKVDACSNTIVGAEALVRWNDPYRGQIPPDDFIPLAEETGLITQIGYWVLRNACQQNKAWQDRGLKPVRIAVNVSGCQFIKPDMVEKVTDILDETGLAAKYLELEITESMLLSDVDEMIARLQRLRDLGIHVSIDDFGTGYSCLSYLSRFPISTLKIDRAFIKDLATNSNMAEIARTIIGLSQGLKLEVVAEGVESQEHIDFLLKNGCEMVQGFYFSQPMPAAEFEELLKNGYTKNSD